MSIPIQEISAAVRSIILVFPFFVTIFCLPKKDFYPYGAQYGDNEVPRGDEGSSDEITLPYGPFTFYQVEHRRVFVNLNGLISFDTDIAYYANQELRDFSYSIIAPFYADVDTHVQGQPDVTHGQVYYRVTNDSAVLQKFKQKVVQNFADSRSFVPKSMLIATWNQVGYFDGKYDKMNTFQVVLAQGRLQSYVEFLYADDEIQWTKSDSKDQFSREASVQVGFVNDDGRSHVLKQSGKPEIAQINRDSNIGVPGDYLFRVSGDSIVTSADAKSYSMDPDRSTVAGDSHDGDVDELDDEYYDNALVGGPDGDDYYGTGGSDYSMTSSSTFSQADESSTPETTSAYRLPPAPEWPQRPDDDMTTTPIITTYSMENELTESTTIDLSTVSSTSTTTTYRRDSVPPFPICDDDPYEANDCPTGCTVEIVAPGCQKCLCQESTTLITTGSQTTIGLPAAGQIFCVTAGPSVCHQNAQCQDYRVGYCCHCSYGYYGNGLECLPTGEPQRVNGKVYGKLNGVNLAEMDLHTYGDPKDGRAYTAISQVTPSVGRSLLLLSTLGNIMGWLFAKPVSTEAYNGFELTGGLFNRTVTVRIDDRYTVTVNEEFSGKDPFQSFKVKTYIAGTLPEIKENSTIDYGEYSEEYNRLGQGVVKSFSTAAVSVKTADDLATIQSYAITVDQTIRYVECPFHVSNKSSHIVLKIERSYVYFDPKENIVRYASANLMDKKQDLQDPCRAHNCTGPQMTCISQGETYRCLCLDGYEMTFAGGKGFCKDIDECALNIHQCDANAVCQNKDGSYTCTCKPGFRGTGQKCITHGHQDWSVCGSSRCVADAYCVPDSNRGAKCVCKTGFRGDGNRSCVREIVEEDSEAATCNSHEECHRNGACIYSRTLVRYHCQCRPPYSGDGKQCVLHGESCDQAHNCHINANCVYKQNELGGAYVCRCKSGFSGDGYNCTRSGISSGIQCNVLNTCSPNAECISTAQGYVCRCKADFKGDGYRCEAYPPAMPSTQPCRSQEDCHASGHCVNRDGREDYFCECLPGFRGDGITICEPADQCNPGVPNNTCGAHARCAYDDAEMAYVCRCVAGYYGDGKVCGLQPPSPPVTAVAVPTASSCRQDATLCHQRAACTIDDSHSMYRCICNAGYRGDGYTSCEPERPLCNQQNICDPNARCQQDDRGDYKCLCNEGFEGDGLYCRASQDCLRSPNKCDRNAVCILDGSKYVCRCKSGFHGSGQKCFSEEDLRDNTIVFAQGMSLIQRGLSEDDISKQLVVVPQQIAVGLYFDCKNEKLYWTDVTGHAIRTANVDGSNVSLFLETGLESPEGLAVDFTSGNIYYADSQADIIGVVRMDGKYNYALIREGLVNPRALAIDFIDKKLYYSDWNRDRPIIGRINLDGTEKEVFLDADIALPNGLVVLHRRRELCWADAGKQRLECINVRGSGRRVIYAPLSHPFGLAEKKEELLFWTDWEDKKIHSISIHGTGHTTYPPAVGSSAKMYGIVTLSDECSYAGTRCLENNGGCKQICLPDSRNGRRCICSDNASDIECSA